MRKILLILVLSTLSTAFVFSQNQNAAKNKKKVYCELLGTKRFMSNKVTVEVDYGQETSFWGTDTRIRDEQSGKAKKFNSMVDAMNFMGKDGWKFVQAFTVTEGNQNVYHWLLENEIEDTQEKTN